MSQYYPNDLNNKNPTRPHFGKNDYPQRWMYNKNRRFVITWYDNREWLEYSVIKDAAYCFPCRTISPHNVNDPFTTTDGYQNWHVGKKAIEQHEKLASHKNAMSQWKVLKDTQVASVSQSNLYENNKQNNFDSIQSTEDHSQILTFQRKTSEEDKHNSFTETSNTNNTVSSSSTEDQSQVDQNWCGISIEKRRELAKRVLNIDSIEDISIVIQLPINTNMSINEFKNVNIEHVIGDGNCFFRALSYIISGRQDYHEHLRKKTKIEGMKKNAEWATEDVIIEFANMLEIDIVVYTDDLKRWQPHRAKGMFSNENTKEAILLKLENKNHFDIITKCNNQSSNFETLKPNFINNNISDTTTSNGDNQSTINNGDGEELKNLFRQTFLESQDENFKQKCEIICLSSLHEYFVRVEPYCEIDGRRITMNSVLCNLNDVLYVTVLNFCKDKCIALVDLINSMCIDQNKFISKQFALLSNENEILPKMQSALNEQLILLISKNLFKNSNKCKTCVELIHKIILENDKQKFYEICRFLQDENEKYNKCHTFLRQIKKSFEEFLINKPYPAILFEEQLIAKWNEIQIPSLCRCLSEYSDENIIEIFCHWRTNPKDGIKTLREHMSRRENQNLYNVILKHCQEKCSSLSDLVKTMSITFNNDDSSFSFSFHQFDILQKMQAAIDENMIAEILNELFKSETRKEKVNQFLLEEIDKHEACYHFLEELNQLTSITLQISNKSQFIEEWKAIDVSCMYSYLAKYSNENILQKICHMRPKNIENLIKCLQENDDVWIKIIQYSNKKYQLYGEIKEQKDIEKVIEKWKTLDSTNYRLSLNFISSEICIILLRILMTDSMEFYNKMRFYFCDVHNKFQDCYNCVYTDQSKNKRKYDHTDCTNCTGHTKIKERLQDIFSREDNEEIYINLFRYLTGRFKEQIDSKYHINAATKIQNTLPTIDNLLDYLCTEKKYFVYDSILFYCSVFPNRDYDLAQVNSYMYYKVDSEFCNDSHFFTNENRIEKTCSNVDKSQECTKEFCPVRVKGICLETYVVYEIKCLLCPDQKAYIGETGQEFHDRVMQHWNAANKPRNEGNKSYAWAKHYKFYHKNKSPALDFRIIRRCQSKTDCVYWQNEYLKENRHLLNVQYYKNKDK